MGPGIDAVKDYNLKRKLQLGQVAPDIIVVKPHPYMVRIGAQVAMSRKVEQMLSKEEGLGSIPALSNCSFSLLGIR